MAEGEFPQKYHPMRKEERKGRKGADSSVIEELSAFAHVRASDAPLNRQVAVGEGGRMEQTCLRCVRRPRLLARQTK